jgi:hypothetical protein
MAKVWIDGDGCIHIKDQKLINAIIAKWGNDPTNICIVLDGGGGGAPANSMCSCATSVTSRDKNSKTYPEPKDI